VADPQGALLGNAHGYIHIDSSNAIAGINQTKAQFNNFIQQTGAMMQGWGNQIANIGQNMSLWSLPITAAVGAGLNVAADFDTVLTEIQARTGLTAEAMEQVRQTALQLGADTAFSSQQAADAFLNLLTAGLSVEESLATLPQVLTAAAAGQMDLATAADLTTSIMASFNLSAQDSTAIIDAMSRASAASPASMNEIGIAMKDVGGLAQMFNLSLDQTAAVLAIFAQNGIRGAEAGTQLRSLLLNLSSPTDATAAAWDRLGTSLYNADGSMRNLDDVLEDIRVGLARLPVEEQNEIISQLAGSYGIVGFNALLASDGISAMTETMASQAAAADVADQMMNTFLGWVDALKGSIDTFAINVLTPFMNNVLKPLIGGSDGKGGLIGVVNAMNSWAAANAPVVQTIMTMIAALVSLGPTLFLVGRGMQLFGFFLGVVANPLAWVTAAVGGIVYLFRDQLWGAITGIISPITNMIAAIEKGIPVLDVFQHALYMIGGENLAQRFASLRQIVTDTLNRIRFGVDMFFLYLQNGASVVTALRTTIGALFGTSPEITDFFDNIFNGIDQFSSGISLIKSSIDKFIGTFRLAFDLFIGQLQDGVSPLIALQSAVSRAFGGDSGITRFVIFAITKFVEFRNIVGNVISRVQNAITTFFRLLESGQSVLFSLKGAFFELFGNTIWFERFIGIARSMSNIVTSAFARISRAVSPAFQQISIFVQRVITAIQEFFRTLSSGESSAAQSLDPMVRSFVSFGETIMRTFEGAMEFITVFFRTLNEGSSFVYAFWSAVYTVFGSETAGQIQGFVFAIGQSFQDFANGIINGFMAVWNFLQPIFAWFAQNVTFQDLLVSIGIALAVLNAPLIAAALGFVALIAAVSLFRQAWETNWGGIQDKTFGVMTTFEQLGILIPYWLNQASVAAGQLATLFGIAVAWIVTKFLEFGVAVATLLVTAWTTAEQIWFLIGWAFQQIGQAIFDFVANAITKFQELTTWLGDVWNAAWQAVIDFFTGLWTAVVGGFEAFKTGIQSAFQWIIDTVMSPFETAWMAFQGIFSGLWGAVSGGIDAFKNGISGAFSWIQTNVIDPFLTTIQGVVDAVNTLTGSGTTTQLGGGGQSVQSQSNPNNGIGGRGGFGGGGLGKSFVIPKFATGINFIPSEMIAQLHPGEAVIPANLNPFNPNAQTNGLGGGVHIENVNISGVRTYEEGREAARGFSDQFEQIAIERGLR
jgi:TP901 family phage tail tape measure protein